MIITGVADRMPGQHPPPGYRNAFVANYGESASDMLPPECIALFDVIASERGRRLRRSAVWSVAGSIHQYANLDTTKRAYHLLNLNPPKTLTDKICLRTNRNYPIFCDNPSIRIDWNDPVVATNRWTSVLLETGLIFSLACANIEFLPSY